MIFAKCVFLLDNYLYVQSRIPGLNWSCPNLSCMASSSMQHIFSAGGDSTGAILKCSEVVQPQVLQVRSQQVNLFRLNYHQLPCLTHVRCIAFLNSYVLLAISLQKEFNSQVHPKRSNIFKNGLPMTQCIPKASHIFQPCQALLDLLEDSKALQPVHSILPS